MRLIPSRKIVDGVELARDIVNGPPGTAPLLRAGVKLSARYASLLGAASGVRVLAMPLRMPTLDLFLYWHDRVHNDPANRWLRLQLVEALGKTARP